MPDYVNVLAVMPDIDLGDTDDDTWETLREALEVKARSWRKQTVRVLCESPWEAAAFGVFIVADGEVDEEFSRLSLRADKLAPTKAAVTPTLRLACDADRFVDAVSAASGADAGAKGRVLDLPFRWASLEDLVAVLRLIAPELSREQVLACVWVEGGLAQVTIHRERGVLVEPLHVWFEDEAARAMGKAYNRVVRHGLAAPITGKAVAVFVDALQERGRPLGGALTTSPAGASPLERGSAQSRDNAVWKSTSTREVEAALESAANVGERFDGVRLSCYEKLQKEAPERALELISRRLPSEPPKLRSELYALLTKLDDPRAHRVLANGFEREDPEIQQRLEALVWRQRGAVLLLAQRLVDSWPEQQALCSRIIEVFRREYISVPAAQLKTAPRDLLEALGPVVAG